MISANPMSPGRTLLRPTCNLSVNRWPGTFHALSVFLLRKVRSSDTLMPELALGRPLLTSSRVEKRRCYASRRRPSIWNRDSVLINEYGLPVLPPPAYRALCDFYHRENGVAVEDTAGVDLTSV